MSAVAVAFVLFCYFLLRGPEDRLKLPAAHHAPTVILDDSHGLVLAADGSMLSWGGEDRGWPVLGFEKKPHGQSCADRVGYELGFRLGW